MRSLNDRLQELTQKLTSGELCDSKKLANEINFHIFDYDPEDEYIIRDYLYKYLAKKDNLKIKIIDVYDLIIEILNEEEYLSKCFEYEKKHNTKQLNVLISRIIGIGTNNDLLIKKIKDKVEPNDIVIITGIGKSYEIVRGHTILNNLQNVIRDNPLILFYPGTYSGQYFKLFNIFENDNYYRAFQLISRK